MPNAPRQFRPSWLPSKQQVAKQYEQSRKTATERGYDHKWTTYARWRRSQPQEALCGMCERAPSELLDHVIAAKEEGAPEFMDPSNHCGMCKKCHGRKSVLVDHAYGRRMGEEGRKLLERLKKVAAERWASIQATMGSYGG
jgi:5-methylcytosine-specific restriction endonuclease McrA